MPYIFPKRKLSTGDILDPLDLNDDVLPSVELYSGELNEHNITASGTAAFNTLGDGNIASNAYYSFIQESRVVDPNFGSYPHQMAQLTNILPSDKIPNNGGWTAIPLDGPTDTSALTIADNAVLWIEASIQYAVAPETFPRAQYAITLPLTRVSTKGQYLVGNERRSAQVQFAIRLDGAVLPWTITGHRDPFHQSPRGEKPSVAYPIGPTSQGAGVGGEVLPADPGPKIEHDPGLGTMGNSYYPVRLGTTINVTAGKHTVELVARRLPEVNQTRSFNKQDVVSVYTRKLFAIQIPQIPRASSTFDSIEVVPFDSESVVSATTMTASVDAVRDKFNAVKDGALARGALREQHLPTAVLGSATASRTSSAVQSVTERWPGWGNSTQVGTSPVGWTKIGSLEVSQTVTHTVAGQTSKVLVLADLHVTFCKRIPSAGGEEDALGAAAIALSTDGGTTYTVQEDSIVFFNGGQQPRRAPTTVASLRAYSRDNLQIGLTHVINVSSTATYKIAVVCTTIPTVAFGGGAPMSNVVQVQRGKVSSVVLRD
jgi:hypothetical protein